EAEHRHEMFDGLEAFSRPSGDALRRRVGGDEVRVFGLEMLELVQQRVELLVCDFRIVVDVIALFVMTDRITKLLQAGDRIGFGHRSVIARLKPSRYVPNADCRSATASAERQRVL